MWRWRSEHVVAWAICVAAILCPRKVWDGIRMPLISTAEAVAPDRGEAGGDVERLRAALLRAEAELAESERLRKQLSALSSAAPAVPAAAALPVRILGAGGRGGPGGKVRLDAGSRDGVKVPAALVQGSAIAGRLVATSEGASEAELVTAPTFRARGTAIRGALDGIVRGAGTHLVFAPEGAEPDLKPGDAIVTSAHSSFAPGGLAVGVVEKVVRDPETGRVEAHVTPAADLERLDRAIVLLEQGR